MVIVLACVSISAAAKSELTLNELGYFQMPGLNVIVFDDIYPSGHQTGVTIIQHGVRVAANGDLRLEASPGQWSPVPLGGKKVVTDKKRISQSLSYPDPNQNRTGFNPIEYPEFDFSYRVNVEPLEGTSFRITVDLDKPLPQEWVGKVGFNFEFFPGHLFGKSYLMDQQGGVFPVQANGPMHKKDGEWLAKPLATGKQLVVAPEEAEQRVVIKRIKGGDLELWDGRINHNNSWFIVRSAVTAGVKDRVV